MQQPRTPNRTCAFEALVLALLLVWMNCWRAVFAGRMVRQLGRRPELPWTRRRLWRLISTQAALGGTKLLAMPLAIGMTPPAAVVGGVLPQRRGARRRADLGSAAHRRQGPPAGRSPTSDRDG